MRSICVSGEGTAELIEGVFETLETLPPVSRVESDENFTYRKSGNLGFEIYMDGGVYVVVGDLVEMLCRNVVLNDPDSMAYNRAVGYRAALGQKVIPELVKNGVYPRFG